MCALEREKQTVLENDLVVSVLEELDDVRLMMERLLPHFFTGVQISWTHLKFNIRVKFPFFFLLNNHKNYTYKTELNNT